jgi:hypothetical protein
MDERKGHCKRTGSRAWSSSCMSHVRTEDGRGIDRLGGQDVNDASTKGVGLARACPKDKGMINNMSGTQEAKDRREDSK